MEISYSCSSRFFYQYELAYRHLQVAFATKSTVQTLWDNQVIQYVSDSPMTLLGRLKHLILAAIEAIPVFLIIPLVVVIADRYFNNKIGLPPNLDPKAKQAIEATPQFNSYIFKGTQDTHLSDLDVRPANLFFKSLFESDPTTQPGSGDLFAFLETPDAIRAEIFDKHDDEVITVCAKGEKGNLYKRVDGKPVLTGNKDLTDYLGDSSYQISAKEIMTMVDSQKVYVSPLIPKAFYLEVKKALQADKVVTLPGHDQSVMTLAEVAAKTYAAPSSSWSPVKRPIPRDSLYYLSALLKKIEQNPQGYGFTDTTLPYETVKSLTLYQLGAMVVKTESYRTFVGEGYRILKREVGAEDDLMLISASGIRGFHKTARIPGNEQHQLDSMIMKHTFKASLEATGKGAYVVFPAVGMGVWGGDPNVYWRAFFEAVVESGDDLEKIFVNPGHQKSPYGHYKGYGGEEFSLILREFKRKYPENRNLMKIVDLSGHGTDLLLLAHNLKKGDPKRTVAIFNASDPDVTLGDHVGEYVNNLCHASTTEENFAAAGTSGLGFEGITRVLRNKHRIIQAK